MSCFDIRYNVSREFTVPGREDNGFTLIELLVVCALISLMIAVSMPALKNKVFSDGLQKSVRQITGAIREARQEAVGKQDGCFLRIDVDEGTLGYHCHGESDQTEIDEKEQSEKVVELVSGISFLSIWSGSLENVTSGVVDLWINSRGLMAESIINISDGRREMALVCPQFYPEVVLQEKAVSPEDLESF